MSLKMVLSGLEVSSVCILKSPSSVMLLHLGISSVSKSVTLSRNIAVVIPLAGGG